MTVKIRIGKGEPFDVSNDEFRRFVREGERQEAMVWVQREVIALL